ncbi:hypothetical protein CHS0354_018006 [Potamilus streckersoni]|uniref:Uncharacterized protein n=1 Tax=Potamilus streckersoni TaxID=2493646 RepID=A0AAE0WAN7_9BIVA|nr:hypothetical protein CHS0354_018006 [Potamilus streckersoni]
MAYSSPAKLTEVKEQPHLSNIREYPCNMAMINYLRRKFKEATQQRISDSMVVMPAMESELQLWVEKGLRVNCHCVGEKIRQIAKMYIDTCNIILEAGMWLKVSGQTLQRASLNAFEKIRNAYGGTVFQPLPEMAECRILNFA